MERIDLRNERTASMDQELLFFLQNENGKTRGFFSIFLYSNVCYFLLKVSLIFFLRFGEEK